MHVLHWVYNKRGEGKIEPVYYYKDVYTVHAPQEEIQDIVLVHIIFTVIGCVTVNFMRKLSFYLESAIVRRSAHII